MLRYKNARPLLAASASAAPVSRTRAQTGPEPKVGQRPQPDANRVMPRLAGNRVAVDRALAQNVEHNGQHQQRENGKAAALVREDDKDDVLEHDQHAEEAKDQQIQHVMHAADALLLVAVMAVDVGPQ